MKKRKITPNSTHSSSPPKPIPFEIIFSIFSRLPVKSLVRFRCISKFCSNIITTPSFAIVHQPFRKPKNGLLITCSTKLQSSQKLFVADQNGGEATCCLTVPPRFSRYTTQSSNGIVCMDFGICATVCNPSTRQAVTLPFICPKNSPAANSTYYCVNFFGFDAKKKQYKVLNSWSHDNRSRTEYRVYTLGCPNKWRVLDGGPPCYAQRESICINGIIFFRSSGSSQGISGLVSFKVETESFRVLRLPRDAPWRVEETSGLIQLGGRLAIVDYQLNNDNYCFWMPEDYGKEIWTQHSIVFPLYFKKTTPAAGVGYVISGSIDTGEIIMVPQCLSTPFYVFYYDLARAKFRRVEINGLPEFDSFDLFSNHVAVTNYVENILPLP